MKLDTITPLNQTAMEACRLRIDNLTKPLYSLAHLEKIAERLAGVLGVEKPNHLKHSLVIVGADTAVDGPQNRTYGVESHRAMARLAHGASGMHAVAKKVGAQVILVDAGLEKDTTDIAEVEQVKVQSGSRFFAMHPAMTEESVAKALQAGIDRAVALKQAGYQTIGLGNVGERSLLSALAVTAALTKVPVLELLTDNACTLTVKEKAEQLGATLARYAKDCETAEGVLRTVGSPEIAYMTGLVLGGASQHMAIVFDNAITGAAVLAAVHINELVKDYVFTSVNVVEPVQKVQMRVLGLKPFLRYNLGAEEGVGSAMGLSLLDASLFMLNDMKTFGEAGVKVAEDGPGHEHQDGR